ncbi:MAG: hypothetical protein ABSD53_10525 [Terriglobales bacterium]
MLVGGTVVSAFSLLGEVLKPKSFAGLLSAAPSVALATIPLAAAANGREYVSIEARTMVLGALAFFVYAVAVSRMLIRWKWPVLPVTSLSLLLWFAGAFALWYALLGTAL